MSAPTAARGTAMEVGPYDRALPGPMMLALELEPVDAGIAGWGARIRSAQVELGFNYVGLEEMACTGIEWGRALQLVEGICGGCAQANALAFVQAAEDISQLIVPPRAAYLRLVLAELERVVSHLGNAAEIMAALSMYDRETTMRDLRERLVHAAAEWSGARLQPGIINFGGLQRNMDEGAVRALAVAARHTERVLRAHTEAIVNSREIAARLTGLGVIGAQEAHIGGLRGPVARGSGIAVDVRASSPAGAYQEEPVTVVVQRGGDAFSRLVVRLLECLESLRLIEQVLDDLPSGPVKARGPVEVRGGSGIGRHEGPRGEVLCWVRGGPDGVTGLHISSGSFPTLAVLEGLLAGAPAEDLPLIMLSLDMCLPCTER